MKTKNLFCTALFLSISVVGCSTAKNPPRQYITPSINPAEERPWVSWYEKPSAKTLRRIKIRRIALTKADVDRLAILPKQPTNSASWLVEEDPDTMHEGPWKTSLYIFNNTDTNHCVRVELADHTSGGVKCEWLNDKMLFVEVWWGHIAYTDFVLNTENLRFHYMEDGFSTSLPDEMTELQEFRNLSTQ